MTFLLTLASCSIFKAIPKGEYPVTPSSLAVDVKNILAQYNYDCADIVAYSGGWLIAL